MNAKDTEQLARWLQGRASLADVESVSRFGLVDNERFTEHARRAYRLAWEWSAIRLSSAAQDRAWRHGAAFVNRRIERCNRMIARFLQGGAR